MIQRERAIKFGFPHRPEEGDDGRLRRRRHLGAGDDDEVRAAEALAGRAGLCGNQIYGAFVLHAIDAIPARWRGGAGLSRRDSASTATSSPRNDLVKNCRVHPAHWLISTQVSAQNARRLARLCLSYSNRWLEAFENTHRTCAESLTQKLSLIHI